MQERRKILDRRKRESKHGQPANNTQSHIPAVVTGPEKSLITILLCAYNEAGILAENLQEIDNYLSDATDKYRWEIVIVNDGSTDDTGIIAEDFAASRPYVHVIHHSREPGSGTSHDYTEFPPVVAIML